MCRTVYRQSVVLNSVPNVSIYYIYRIESVIYALHPVASLRLFLQICVCKGSSPPGRVPRGVAQERFENDTACDIVSYAYYTILRRS